MIFEQSHLSNSNSAVVLLNGSPVDMTAWQDGCGAVLEAWFPGEQGAQAICEILFGEISPSGKLPITFPKTVGQLPLFYSMKPSGRGYGYIENDGNIDYYKNLLKGDYDTFISKQITKKLKQEMNIMMALY